MTLPYFSAAAISFWDRADKFSQWSVKFDGPEFQDLTVSSAEWTFLQDVVKELHFVLHWSQNFIRFGFFTNIIFTTYLSIAYI
jgi:hypothetical protein